jgi:adiponectin receptor
MRCNCKFRFCHKKFDPEVPKCAQIDFINTGYRCELNIKESFKSIWYIHNETFNIWSHLIASIGFIFCLFSEKSFILGICFFSMFSSMLFSTMYHIFCSSTSIYYYALSCDNIGMFNTIFACVGSAVYYFGKVINYQASIIYLVVFLLFGIFSCGLFIFPTLKYGFYKNNDIQGDQVIRSNKFAPYCIIFSISFWIIPCIHSFFVNYTLSLTLLKIYSIEYITWIFTFLIWFLRFPEKKFVGKFDYFGNSHNIFHVLIIMDNFFHIYNVLKCNSLEF